MKKVISFLLVALFLFAGVLTNAASFSNFTKKYTYTSSTYTDINLNEWYGEYVKNCYELGLMQGVGAGVFDHNGNITIAQAITMAARVHNIYNGGNGVFDSTGVTNWYDPMVDYALKNGIIKTGDFTSYTKSATRAEMAYIFSRSLPDKEFEKINVINSIPDVKSNAKYYSNILKLYTSGIVNGSDAEHNFYPNDNIKRREAAAIICRVVNKDERIVIPQEEEPTEEDVFEEEYFEPEEEPEEEMIDGSYEYIDGQYVFVPEEEKEIVIFDDVKKEYWSDFVNTSAWGYITYVKQNDTDFDKFMFGTFDEVDTIDFKGVRVGYAHVNLDTGKSSFIGHDVTLSGGYEKVDTIYGAGQYSIEKISGRTTINVALSKEDTAKIRSIKNFSRAGIKTTENTVFQCFIFGIDKDFYNGAEKCAYIIDFVADEVPIINDLNKDVYYYCTGVFKGMSRYLINTEGKDMKLVKVEDSVQVWTKCNTITFCDNPDGNNPVKITLTDSMYKNGIKLSEIFK